MSEKTKNPSVEMTATTGDAEELPEAYDKDAAINISEHFIMQIEQRMDVCQWLLVQYK